MSDTDSTLLATLRERAEALVLDIADARRELTVLEAQHVELVAIIEIISGRSVARKKPGRKPGWRKPDLTASVGKGLLVTVPDPEPKPPPLGDAA